MNYEIPDLTDRTNETMATDHPLVTHDKAARFDRISSCSRVNLVARVRQLCERTRHLPTVKRQARVASYQKRWKIWLNYKKNVIVGILLALSNLIPVYAATYYLEPGEKKIVGLTPTLKQSKASINVKQNVYGAVGICINESKYATSTGTCAGSTGWKSGGVGVYRNEPTHISSDNLLNVKITHEILSFEHGGSPLTFGQEYRFNGGSSWITLRTIAEKEPSSPTTGWAFSTGSVGLNKPITNGHWGIRLTNLSSPWSLSAGVMNFSNTKATIQASASAVPGTVYNVPVQQASTAFTIYDVWETSQIIITHPCWVSAPANQTIDFGTNYVSGSVVPIPASSQIINEVTCAGSVANRRYTITSPDAASGSDSIPMKAIGGGGTVQGNIYLSPTNVGSCPTPGRKTLGTRYLLPLSSGFTYKEDLYATLCSVANAEAGPGKATATITYDWN